MAKVPINEAAVRLGISLDVARSRVKKGQLPAEKIRNRWYVELDNLSPLHLDGSSSPGSHLDGAHDAPSQHLDGSGVPWREYVETLQHELTFLRDELERRSEELRRKDIIIADLARRPLELPPATPAPSGQRDTATPPQPRTWWKRLFGLA